jgi:L-seryl-tRNA(Ser) seleniumtransferase
VRIDKLSLAALEATLDLYRDPARALREVPVLRMLLDDPGPRAERLAALTGGEVVEAAAKVGGGALPLTELPGPVVALDAALAEPLRLGDPAVLGRVREGRLLLDPRTLADDEVELVAAAVEHARR